LLILNLEKPKLTLQQNFQKNETKIRKVDEDNQQYNDKWI